MAWEYLKLEYQTAEMSDFERQATKLGAVGWELVTVMWMDRTIGLNGVMAVFKRERAQWPVGPSEPSPQWAPDPWARFEHRYWDGLRWTADVSNGGETQLDIPG